MSGDHILADHCYFSTDDDGAVTIAPADGENALVLVNGRRIDGPKRLKSGYRLIIGSNHVFRFNHPLELQRERIHQPHQEGLFRSASPKARRNSLESLNSRTNSPEPLASSTIDWSFAVKEREEHEPRSGSVHSNDDPDLNRNVAKRGVSHLTLRNKQWKEEWEDRAQKIAELEVEIAAAKTHLSDMEAGLRLTGSGPDISTGSRPSSLGSNKSLSLNSPSTSSAASNMSPRLNVSVINVGSATITVGDSAIGKMQKGVQREIERIRQLERRLELEKQALFRKISSDTLRNAQNASTANINASIYTDRERQVITRCVSKWKGRRWVAMARDLERLKKTFKEANIMSIELGVGVAYSPYVGDLSKKASFWEVPDNADAELDESDASVFEDVGLGVLVLDAKHER